MATLDAGLYGSIKDIANRLDPDGSAARVIEILSQDNALLDDMVFTATNDLTTHQTTRRSGLPALHRRRINTGIPASKDATIRVTDRTTHIEGRSQVDTAHEKIYGPAFGAYRNQQDQAFAMSMNHRFNYDMVYATTASDPEDMSGLAQRYGSKSTEWGGQLINGGGTGSDNMSIYLVGHGAGGVVGLYPRNSKAGMSSEDKGVQRVQDASGLPFYAYETLFDWHYGLAVEDPRAVVRICNIDKSALEKAVSTGADLLSLMTDALQKAMRPGMASLRWCFYAPRYVHNYIYHQALNKSSVELTLEESQTGGNVQRFRNPVWLGYPIKIVDQLKETEATISFA